MRTHRWLAGLVPLLAAGTAAAASDGGPMHRHRHHARHVVVGVAPYVTVPAPDYAVPPLAATVGTAIPPEAARFMGYPYNVPGYRYVGYDACLLRVGGPFGPGPSAAPCPFGLDGLY